MSMRKKMALGAFWLFLEKGAAQISSLVVFAIIARLIGPEEYGLVGLCGIFMALTGNLISGLVDAVISMHIKDDARLSTIFWIVLFCGLALSLGIFILAAPFAEFMGHEKLIPLMRSFSVLPIIMALPAVPTALITAAMDFKIFTIRTLVSALAGGLVGVIMAIHGYGAYAIVAQQIVMFFLRALIVWTHSNWRPKFVLSGIGLSEILKLGLSQTSSSIVSFTEQQLPRLLIGLYIGATAVGQFVFIMRLRYALEEALVLPLITVLYPAFSKMRDDFEEKRKILKQIILLLGCIILPAAWGAAVTAPIYIPMLFGKAWEPSIPLLEIIFLVSPLVCINFVLGDLFRAHKRTADYLHLQTMIVIVSSLLLLWIAPFGILIFMLAIAAGIVFSFLAYTFLAEKKLALPVWQSYAALRSPLVASAVLVGVILGLDQLLAIGTTPFTQLFVSIIAGIATYLLVFLSLERRHIRPLILLLKERRVKNVI